MKHSTSSPRLDKSRLVLPKDSQFALEYAKKQFLKYQVKQDKVLTEIRELAGIPEDSDDEAKLYEVLTGLTPIDHVSFTGKHEIGAGE